MAESLEGYVQQDYERERAPLEEITKLTDDAFDVLVRTFLDKERAWPYEVVDGERILASPEYSFSTNAMIAFALRLLSGRVAVSALVPAAVTPLAADVASARSKRVGPMVDAAVLKLVEEAERLPGDIDKIVGRNNPKPPSTPPYTWSGTYGWDDPFTYNWLLELLADDGSDEHQRFRAAVCDRARDRIESVLSHPEQPVLKMRENQEVAHTFPRLRVLQLRETVMRITGSDPAGDAGVAPMNKYLLERVRRQLSESQTAGGEFDPADLVFALEGWIMTTPAEPRIGLVKQTFAALRDRREDSAYWRPVLPFKATQQGLVLLPQSVEVANSLLRICGMKSLSEANWFSDQLDVLEPYRQWLTGRVFHGLARGGDETVPFLGWESEHTHRGDRIHLWQTSQVLIFLQHYAAMLKQHLARKLLRLGNLIPDRTTEGRALKARTEGWAKFRQSEPLDFAEEGSAYRVYERLDSSFVAPRLSGARDTGSFSMLLYGPPGTGKSYIARQLSKALGFPLLTITPSDFVTSGGEAVEARTKAIFTALGEQTGLVVLFDEIDHLLLDRSSKLYREQGDLFKLLTPGMLTKLVKLGEQRSVIFVIATNYYERIDRAIRRAGRIDARYLVLPPSLGQRERYLDRELAGWATLDPDRRNELLRATVRLTYSELGTVVESAAQDNGAAKGDDLYEALRQAIRADAPMAANEGYTARLMRLEDAAVQETEAGAIDRPLEEVALLVRLDLEAGRPNGDQPDVIVQALTDALKGGYVKDASIASDLHHALEAAGRRT